MNKKKAIIKIIIITILCIAGGVAIYFKNMSDRLDTVAGYWKCDLNDVKYYFIIRYDNTFTQVRMSPIFNFRFNDTLENSYSTFEDSYDGSSDGTFDISMKGIEFIPDNGTNVKYKIQKINNNKVKFISLDNSQNYTLNKLSEKEFTDQTGIKLIDEDNQKNDNLFNL